MSDDEIFAATGVKPRHGYTRYPDGAWIELPECDPECEVHPPKTEA